VAVGDRNAQIGVQTVTKSSPRRLQRRNIRKLARAEAEKIGPAEARRKLAEWAARGGDMDALKRNELPRIRQ
jgi:hypothetical protein